MKVCVTSQGETLDSPVDPRFGRCQFFLFVDPQTLDFEAKQNPSVMASGGAGIQAAQLVISSGANVVVTGSIGPNAFQTLTAGGVSVYTGASGSVKEAIRNYSSGKLMAQSGPTGPVHAGLSSGVFPDTNTETSDLKKDVSRLKEQIEEMKKQLDTMRKERGDS